MNAVILIGRITKDPEVRYTDKQVAVCKFNLAVNRQTKSQEEQQADFINIVALGKIAENLEKFVSKGQLIGVQGRIQTGSYTNRDGNKVYTTNVLANSIEFLEFKNRSNTNEQFNGEEVTEGFEALGEDDLPF